MKTFAELKIRGISIERITEELRAFCSAADGWSTDEERNESYSVIHGEQCFWIIPPHNLTAVPAAIALSGCPAKKPKMKMVNIVPSTSGQLAVEDYNAAAAAFVQQLRFQMRRRAVRGLRLEFRDGLLDLADVVTGPASRKAFARFLAGHPRSYHPSDIQKLDYFIVALHRGGRCANAYRIEQFLIQDEKWDRNDAAWVRDRVVVGLDVLRARTLFFRGR